MCGSNNTFSEALLWFVIPIKVGVIFYILYADWLMGRVEKLKGGVVRGAEILSVVLRGTKAGKGNNI